MSYLWAEEDCDGEPTGVFRERYFILFPLCGLRWFSESPHPHGNNTDRYDADNTTSGGGGGASTAYKGGDDAATYDAALLMRTASDGQCGWVFGGGITLSRARTAGPHISQYHPSLAGHLDVDVANPGAAAASGSGAEAVDLFPFILELQCDDDATSVRLAARSAHQVRACVCVPLYSLHVCLSLSTPASPLLTSCTTTTTTTEGGVGKAYQRLQLRAKLPHGLPREPSRAVTRHVRCSQRHTHTRRSGAGEHAVKHRCAAVSAGACMSTH
jgi:hypothetical protein